MLKVNQITLLHFPEVYNLIFEQSQTFIRNVPEQKIFKNCVVIN